MPKILYKDLSYAIVGAAMDVHNILGRGFLEAVYQAALTHELTLRSIAFETQKRLPVYYKGQLVGDYIADPSISSGQVSWWKAKLSSNSKPSPNWPQSTKLKPTTIWRPQAYPWLSCSILAQRLSNANVSSAILKKKPVTNYPNDTNFFSPFAQFVPFVTKEERISHELHE